MTDKDDTERLAELERISKDAIERIEQANKLPEEITKIATEARQLIDKLMQEKNEQTPDSKATKELEHKKTEHKPDPKPHAPTARRGGGDHR